MGGQNNKTPSRQINGPIGGGAPALLTLEMICEHFLPLGKRTIHRWIAAGQFPRPDISEGAKVRLWMRETVESWINTKAQQTKNVN